MLTRQLFWKTEVEASLTRAILAKHDIKECYYWTTELQESGFDDVFELLWQIYYDFYFEYNPKLETFIRKSRNKYNIVLNMFKAPHSNKVFLIRNEGRIPKMFQDHPFIDRVLTIDNEQGVEQCFEMVVDHYALNDGIWKYLNSCQYHDKKHYLLAVIVHLECPENRLVSKSRFYVSRYKPEPFEPSQPLYRFLRKRPYCIHPDIGCYDICRFDWRPCWEYHANKAPYWERIFRESGCRFHGEKIVFDTDDAAEAFYETYGYEPEEQALSVTFQDITHISWDVFYQKIEEELLCKGLDKIW